jgi:hypothetical protein
VGNDKVIQFPGVRSTKVGAQPGAVSDVPVETLPQLNPEQQKAIGLILSGTTFIFIGIKPADRGADFFTALHGDHTDLRNAQDHLPDVINRLYSRKGIQ